MLVDQGDGAVFQEAAGHAFCVEVGDFFEFQRRLKGDSAVDTPSDEKPVGNMAVHPPDTPDGGNEVGIHVPEGLWEGGDFLQVGGVARVREFARLQAQLKCDTQQDGDLGNDALRTEDTEFPVRHLAE